MKKKTGLQECKKLRDEYLDGWKRARAELLNYKKGEAERSAQLKEYAKEELILKILSILDNFYLAEESTPDDLKDNSWVEGFLKIKDQMVSFLRSEGVEEIKCLGKKFDPNFQEAVQEIKKKGVESGIVLEEIKKGYTFSGRVLRPARVKISK